MINGNEIRMKKLEIFISICVLFFCSVRSYAIPDCYAHVDQVLWVVSDLDRTISDYGRLGFTEVLLTENAVIWSNATGNRVEARLARANLGGALVNWIQLQEGNSVFHEFHSRYGDGAMALVHRFPDGESMHAEINRLKELGIGLLDEVHLDAGGEDLHFFLMETAAKGKYTLGFTYGRNGLEGAEKLDPVNRHSMRLNQYAFAIRDPEPVSDFWERIGLPPLEINLSLIHI